jgi:hypothetical protein
MVFANLFEPIPIFLNNNLPVFLDIKGGGGEENFEARKPSKGTLRRCNYFSQLGDIKLYGHIKALQSSRNDLTTLWLG